MSACLDEGLASKPSQLESSATTKKPARFCQFLSQLRKPKISQILQADVASRDLVFCWTNIMTFIGFLRKSKIFVWIAVSILGMYSISSRAKYTKIRQVHLQNGVEQYLTINQECHNAACLYNLILKTRKKLNHNNKTKIK